MIFNSPLRCGSALLLAVALIGCNTGPRMYTVTGTVSFDGSPLSEGDITFVPSDATRGPTQGKIKDGKFEFKALEGSNKVEISASKIKPGGAKGAGGEPVPEEFIPERYNVNSKLTADVTSSGTNQFDFKLESKSK